MKHKLILKIGVNFQAFLEFAFLTKTTLPAKLLTTIGIGRVMVNTPMRAQKPPTNFPMKLYKINYFEPSTVERGIGMRTRKGF